MVIPRALVLIAMAIGATLAIGLPLGWGFSQFHHSAQPLQAEAAKPPANTIAANIQKEPEEFWGKWIDPVALGTFMLAIAAFWTARIVLAQVRLARQEFLSTHRPKLRVRKVSLYPLVDGAPVTVQYEIANIGDTDAILTFADVKVGARSRNYFGKGGHMGSDLIQPGARLTVRFDTSLMWRGDPYSRYDLTIWGEVNYRDASKIERRTEFERFPDMSSDATNQYMRAKEPNPDYEYED
jgi:hypothetical protein